VILFDSGHAATQETDLGACRRLNQHDLVGRNVLVNDAPGVRRFEGRRHLLGDEARARNRQPSLSRHYLPQILPAEIFHHHKWPGILGLSSLLDPHGVRMAKGARSPRLLLEALDQQRVAHQFRAEHFEDTEFPRAHPLRLVDFSDLALGDFVPHQVPCMRHCAFRQHKAAREFQMANGKRQISKGRGNHLPFALCHLPFAILSPMSANRPFP
jgi:hypothetical protein